MNLSNGEVDVSEGVRVVGFMPPQATVRNSVPVELIDAAHDVALHLQLVSNTKLKLDNRALVSISENIATLSVSEVLLRKNLFSEPPAGLFAMSNLQWLVLSDNRLTSLDGIARCTALTRLLLANNQLVRLPRELGLMSQLKHLNVARNRLVALPVELARLTRLETLNIAHNLLCSLPVELDHRLPESTSLSFNGNLMRSPATFESAAQAREWLFAHFGVISHIDTIRARATTVVVALQDLALPALVLVEILDAAFNPNDIRMAAKWDLVVVVKHFRDRQRAAP